MECEQCESRVAARTQKWRDVAAECLLTAAGLRAVMLGWADIYSILWRCSGYFWQERLKRETDELFEEELQMLIRCSQCVFMKMLCFNFYGIFAEVWIFWIFAARQDWQQIKVRRMIFTLRCHKGRWLHVNDSTINVNFGISFALVCRFAVFQTFIDHH